jgi:hypothetical protein
MQQIHHKKNELFEVELYKDKEYTEAFDFTNAKNLYIERVNGDITPLLELHDNIHTDDVNVCVVNITAPQMLQFGKYIVGADELNSQAHGSPQSDTKYYFLNVSDYNDVFEGYSFDNFINITPNLSKYIPEDNAVLFLRADCCKKYMKSFQNHHIGLYANDGLDKVTLEGSMNAINEFVKNPIKKITIFLLHGTQSEIQKANEIAKELQEKYGFEEVNLFVLHCFVKEIHYNKWKTNDYSDVGILQGEKYERDNARHILVSEFFVNKIITTNSTGILPVDDKDRLQVIDCKEIFDEYLKENN